MKKIQHFIIILSSFLMSNMAFAYEFQNFKLAGKLQEKAEKRAKLFASRNSAKSLKAIESTNSNLSPLIEELFENLGSQYNSIGEAQTQDLINNYNFGGGVYNFSGFSWYKPMGTYSVVANRSVAPDLFSDKWIVQDTFTINIEAATLLTNLADSGEITITEAQIGAFAGVGFSRTYSYYHYANTYLDGLTADYSKLFLSFIKFSSAHVLSLNNNEVMKRSDNFTFNAGAVATAPVGNGATLQAGVLVQTSYTNNILLQGVEGTEEDPEFLRLSIEKDIDKSVESHLSLQYDFFNILKLSLLSYDLDYTYGESNTTYLSFHQADKELINTSSGHHDEFENLINGDDTVLNWKENIIAAEHRLEENYESNLSFILFGSLKKRATEQIKIIKDGVEKVFFTNYSESTKYIQNFLSRLFSEAIKAIFELDFGASNDVKVSKKMTIEYEKVEGLEAGVVKDEEDFSIQLRFYFQAAKTHKWYHKKYKNAAVKYTKRFSTLGEEITQKIDSKELRGPLVVSTSLEIEESGLNFFNQLSSSQVSQIAVNICEVDDDEFVNGEFVKQRRRIASRIKRIYSSAQKCALKLIERHETYLSELTNHGQINLVKFKKFIGYYFTKTKSISDFDRLFGVENVYLHGSFTATTSSGSGFQTYFQSGQFKGLGVIQEFKSENLITPISLD